MSDRGGHAEQDGEGTQQGDEVSPHGAFEPRREPVLERLEPEIHPTLEFGPVVLGRHIGPTHETSVPSRGDDQPGGKRSAKNAQMKVNRSIDAAAAYSWRLLVIAAAAVGTLWLLAQLWVVVTALVIMILLTRVLASPAAWLRRRLPPALAAAATLFGFLVVVAAVLTTVGVAVAAQMDDIAETVAAGVDDIEEWLVEALRST